MTAGQGAMLHPSLQGMVAAIRSKMSRVALHLRFTKASADFLFASLNTVLKYSVHSAQIMPAVLENFSRVLIFDSSSWDVKPELKPAFRGSGGSASDANCKLQAGYDYKRGCLGFLEITEGAKPDQGYSCCLSNFVKKNDLLLFDLGYFKLIWFQEIIKKKAYFLSRFLIGTSLRDAVTLTQIDIGKILSRFKGDVLDMKVIMGNQHQVACRLICLRVTEQVASARRRKRLKEAKKKGRTPSKSHLELCDWTFLVTNASAEILPVETIFPLYRLRWQIELIFKQLKSVLRIHSSNTKNEYRLRCELYGKLIMAVLIHYLHSSLNFEMWSTKNTEVSFDKLYKRIQERMFYFFHDLLTSAAAAAITKFVNELNSLVSACIKTRQRSRKTTLELLEDSGMI